MRRVLPLKIALASLLIAACVTINVYFPAAAADKAADQVINDITGGGAKGGTTTPPQSHFVPANQPTNLTSWPRLSATRCMRSCPPRMRRMPTRRST